MVRQPTSCSTTSIGTVLAADERADPNHKDIYVEVDFMALHQPDRQAINDVMAAAALRY